MFCPTAVDQLFVSRLGGRGKGRGRETYRQRVPLEQRRQEAQETVSRLLHFLNFTELHRCGGTQARSPSLSSDTGQRKSCQTSTR